MSVEYPRRGEVCLVEFDPARGSEIKNTLPAVVLQNDVANRHSPITIIAAITSKFDQDRLYPTEVFVSQGEGGMSRDGVVLLNQIHSFDKQRLKRKMGRLGAETMKEIDRALLISFGLMEI